jgi:hypothetical protein
MYGWRDTWVITPACPTDSCNNVSCAAAAEIMSYGGPYVRITYLPMLFQAFKDVSPLMRSPLGLLLWCSLRTLEHPCSLIGQTTL